MLLERDVLLFFCKIVLFLLEKKGNAVLYRGNEVRAYPVILGFCVKIHCSTILTMANKYAVRNLPDWAFQDSSPLLILVTTPLSTIFSPFLEFSDHHSIGQALFIVWNLLIYLTNFYSSIKSFIQKCHFFLVSLTFLIFLPYCVSKLIICASVFKILCYLCFCYHSCNNALLFLNVYICHTPLDLISQALVPVFLALRLAQMHVII